jgi:hypothetical protein
VSEERRQGNNELVEKVTRLTTLFEENFDRDNGHMTVTLRDMKAKVDDHDKFITRAKWTLKLASLLGSGGIIAALKAKFGGQN